MTLAGRQLARERGLRIFGSAGVLIEAKSLGRIERMRPILDELLAAGLWLSDAAYRELLALAGE